VSRARAIQLAVWIVIASEALLFSGLFALYIAYRTEYHAEFHAASMHNIVWIGGTNTMILLTSSFAMAWSIHSIRVGNMKTATRSLAGVLLLGTAFLAFKSVEWGIHLREGITPGSAGDLTARGSVLFFALYYMMTGLHALHVIAGIALVAWIYRRAQRRRITQEHHLIPELVGLYWHFVDLVWVFLWPLFYLIK
jgi:cytochrome c oxidase subunit 3